MRILIRTSLHTAALISAAVCFTACTGPSHLELAIDSADEDAWNAAAPGLLDRLRSDEVPPVLEPLAPADRTGLMTAYATPSLRASRRRTNTYAHPIHASPDGGSDLVRSQIVEHPGFDEIAIGWVADRLDCYLVQVNGSCVLEWIDPSNERPTGSRSTLVWSSTNGHDYVSLGRLAIEAGLSGEDGMSLSRLRLLHERQPERIAELMLVNPRYIFFRELDDGDSLQGSRGRPLVPGVSLAADPMHPAGSILLVVPADGGTPVIGLVHDGGAAIVGPQRLDRYRGVGAEAMHEAGRTQVPVRVFRVRLPDDGPETNETRPATSDAG